MNEYIGEEEWEDFKPARDLSPEISGKLWKNINKNSTSPAVHHAYFRWLAVAASVLLIVGLSWQFILRKQKTSITSAATAPIAKNISNNSTRCNIIFEKKDICHLKRNRRYL